MELLDTKNINVSSCTCIAMFPSVSINTLLRNLGSIVGMKNERQRPPPPPTPKKKNQQWEPEAPASAGSIPRGGFRNSGRGGHEIGKLHETFDCPW